MRDRGTFSIAAGVLLGATFAVCILWLLAEPPSRSLLRTARVFEHAEF